MISLQTIGICLEDCDKRIKNLINEVLKDLKSHLSNKLYMSRLILSFQCLYYLHKTSNIRYYLIIVKLFKTGIKTVVRVLVPLETFHMTPYWW